MNRFIPSAALEDPDPNVVLQAISTAARARGMAKVAQESGLGLESLYKALAPGAKLATRPSA